tara:strand:+ start:621 stop:848 length:228 start_codon:yes stop_codon:yes gene_type:complete
MNPLILRILFFGLISFTLYFLIFYYEELVMHYFVLGSWYAIFPITTAFVISIAYGLFANFVIDYFGKIQEKKNKF